MLIARSLSNLVVALVERGDLVLVDGATAGAVSAELVAALGSQADFAQLGSFVSGVLLRSALVDELFVDDVEIIRLLSEVG